LEENLSYNFNRPEREAIERFHAETKRLRLCPEDISLRWL